MKKILSALLVVVISVLGWAIQAQAQDSIYDALPGAGNRGGYNRGGYDRYNRNRNDRYGYYDPAAVQQMMRLPDALLACMVDFSTMKVQACRPIAKSVTEINAFGENHGQSEVLGTFHVEKNKGHFHAFDDTNSRIGTGTGGALGAGGGALLGSLAGRKGAAAGAVGGSIVGGLLGSRKNHNGCLIIEPDVARVAQAEQAVSYEAPVAMNAPRLQPAMTESRSVPVAGPAANQGVGEFELSNSTRVFVEAYDGETYIGRMAPGSTLTVGPPKDRYRGFALVPQPDGRLGKDELDREVSPSGWTFVEPKVAQGR